MSTKGVHKFVFVKPKILLINTRLLIEMQFHVIIVLSVKKSAP